MLIQQLIRSDAEKVFVVGQNVSTATTLGNTLVCWEPIVAAVSLGNAFNQPNTSNLAAFAGVLDADAAANAYQLVQVYGYRSSVAGAVNTTATSVSAAGIVVGPVAAKVSFASNGASFGGLGPLVVLQNDISGSGYFGTFIRAL